MHSYDYEWFLEMHISVVKEADRHHGAQGPYHVTFIHMKYKFFRRVSYRKLRPLLRLRKYCFWIYTAYKPNKRYVGVTLSSILESQKLAKADWLDDWSSRRRDIPSNSLCGVLSGRNLWNNLLIFILISKHRLNWVEFTYFLLPWNIILYIYNVFDPMRSQEKQEKAGRIKKNAF
jgi:hypothetical protein